MPETQITFRPLPAYEWTPLDEAREFVARLVYATPEQLDALVLICVVSHIVNSFTTVPRLLAVSDEPSSGKTTLGINIPRMLAWQFFNATLATEPAIRARFGLGETSLGRDEISDVFGKAGTSGLHSMVYTILKAGYEKGATAEYSNNRVPEPINIYGVAFMAGLRKAAPDDLRKRCVIFNMRPAPDWIASELEDALDPSIRAEGIAIGKAIHQWARANSGEIAECAKNKLKGLHPQLTSRRRQVWGPPAAVAMVAGGDWLDRWRAAFIDMALDAGERPVLVPTQQMLLDAADYAEVAMDERTAIYCRDLLIYCRSLNREVYEAMSDNAMARLMSRALGSKGQSIEGTWKYPLPDGSLEAVKANHKGHKMGENLIRAADLRARLFPKPNPDDAQDEFDKMFE